MTSTNSLCCLHFFVLCILQTRPDITHPGQGQRVKMRLQELIRQPLRFHIILLGVALIREKMTRRMRLWCILTDRLIINYTKRHLRIYRGKKAETVVSLIPHQVAFLIFLYCLLLTHIRIHSLFLNCFVSPSSSSHT